MKQSMKKDMVESVEEANALALGEHTHLLRIRETSPTFINHLVGISLLKVGQKSKPRFGRLSRKVSARGIERVRCINKV